METANPRRDQTDVASEAKSVGKSTDICSNPPQTDSTAHSVTTEDEVSRSLKARLVAYAREIGFDACRVANCGPPPHATEFRGWLRDGSAGEMSYMERGEEKRCDPQKVLPGARSIVVLALNYWQGEEGRDIALRCPRTAQRAVPTP